METLKHSIIEASKAVEEEKTKNVELLRMVFPANIAQKLWRGIIIVIHYLTLVAVVV